MNIQESVKTCFKEKYAVFSGRASRSEFWWFWIVATGLIWIASYVGSIHYWIIGLALLIPSLAVAVRRMHDSGHSGWWLICPIVGFIFLVIPGTKGVNKYDETEDLEDLKDLDDLDDLDDLEDLEDLDDLDDLDDLEDLDDLDDLDDLEDLEDLEDSEDLEDLEDSEDLEDLKKQ